MERVWGRLERWVADHTDASLALRPGAGEDQIREVEEALERPLPPDLRVSFALHDGQELPSLRWFGGERLLHPLASVLDQWRWDAEATEPDLPTGLVDHERARATLRHRGRLPLIGGSDWDGDNVYADLIPGASGADGQVLFRLEQDLAVVGRSWKHFLDRVVSGLESGRLVVEADVPQYREARGWIVDPNSGHGLLETWFTER